MKLWPVAWALLLFFCLPLHASTGEQRAHGAAVFAASGCQHCHSIRSVGGTRGPDLSGVGRRKKKSEMLHQILYGSKVMPAFKDILDPSDVNDLIAYLRSCRDKRAKTLRASNSN
jgi:mono/diheme cytochrome c family protein